MDETIYKPHDQAPATGEYECVGCGPNGRVAAALAKQPNNRGYKSLVYDSPSLCTMTEGRFFRRCWQCSSLLNFVDDLSGWRRVPDGTAAERKRQHEEATAAANLERARRAKEQIRFSCTHCGKPVSVRAEHAGKEGKCPGCQAAVTIPLRSERKAPVPERKAPVQERRPVAGMFSRLFWMFSGLFGSSDVVVCTCKKCGTKYRLGENARVTTPEQMMKLMEREAHVWEGRPDIIGLNSSASREDADVKIVEDAQRSNEDRKWSCGKCETVQKYVWL